MRGWKIWSAVGNIVDIVLRVALWALIVYFIVTGMRKCYDYGYRIFTEEPMSATVGRNVTVEVPVDFTAKELGELFESEGLTRDYILFALQYYCSEYREDVQGGTYQFNTAMTAEEMFEVMAQNSKKEVLEDSEAAEKSDKSDTVDEAAEEKDGAESVAE